MKKEILVIFQDWGNWFTSNYSKFEFWFKELDGAYSKDNNYYILVLGNFNKKIQVEKNIFVEIVKSSPTRQFFDFFKFRKKIKEQLNKKNYDAIYVPFLYLGSLLPKHNQTSIGFLRDKTPEMIKAKGGIRYFVGYIFYLLDYIAMKKLKIVLHNGKSLEKYAKSFGAKGKVIYNPRNISDKEHFKDSVVSKKLTQLKKEKKKIILSVARLVKGKNIELGIKALKHMPKEYVFVVAGEGEEKENLLNLAKELGVSQRFILLDFVQHKRLWEYYKGADLFWLLSKTDFEGTPNVLQEAMFSKIPCIVSKISAMRNIVDSKTGIILKTWDEKELAKKTCFLIDNKKVYKEIVSNSYIKVNKIIKKNKFVREYF